MPENGKDPRDNLKYVSDMLEQLKVLSAGSGGPFLTYLLDMAKTEASERLRAAQDRSPSGQK
ncbi:MULTISPECIES: hypothetical protein [unclassified Aureimonas]|uniref:hypothetical protein n=1 Tax=unclassified Aureimonas TaxID=2615206 RepID=UPI0006F4D4B4|nr:MULTISPECIES: hypothetical protein [unclassified Aureimonas]KQT60434.1 hypothetical protein ASG62_07235 [Aureimonas sp. Leaf427]KQT79312.1 hypothetical protein ASG54_09835 [Aureimonas sp. Leaf460]